MNPRVAPTSPVRGELVEALSACSRMKLARSSPIGPLGSFDLLMTERRGRGSVPGRGSCCGSRRCAPTALRCSVQGRAAELTTRTAFAPFKQPRRVSSRSALRAPTLALRFSSPQKSPLPGTDPLPRVPPLSFAWEENESLSGSAKARAGSRRRASAQPRSAGLVARARSALRLLTRRGCLNGAHEVSVVSSAAGPRDRCSAPGRRTGPATCSAPGARPGACKRQGSQGTLAQRGQAVKRRRLPARAFARTDRRARTTARTTATGRELSSIPCERRQIHWSH